MLDSLFNKVAGLQATQVFPRENCKIFKNTFFHRTPPVAAFKVAKLKLKKQKPSNEKHKNDNSKSGAEILQASR